MVLGLAKRAAALPAQTRTAQQMALATSFWHAPNAMAMSGRTIGGIKLKRLWRAFAEDLLGSLEMNSNVRNF